MLQIEQECKECIKHDVMWNRIDFVVSTISSPFSCRAGDYKFCKVHSIIPILSVTALHCDYTVTDFTGDSEVTIAECRQHG